jgi:microcystin-dependent protein
LTLRDLGERGGSEVTLTIAQMPAHVHAFGDINTRTFSSADTAWERGAREQRSGWLVLGSAPRGQLVYTDARRRRHGRERLHVGDPTSLTAGTSGIAGSSQAHDNMPPYSTLTFIIALQDLPVPETPTPSMNPGEGSRRRQRRAGSNARSCSGRIGARHR